MIADFTKLFKKPTNESNTPPDNKGPRSLITNINPEDPQNQGTSTQISKKKSNKKTGCFGCLLSPRNSISSEKVPMKKYLLSDQSPADKNKKTLVLDLDETLVHSSFQPFIGMDDCIEIDFDGKAVNVYVSVRPGAFDFIDRMSKFFEIVIFTASQPLYAHPVINLIDKTRVVSGRLFRNDCDNVDGTYIKNLSKLGRDLKDVIIIDNSPRAFSMHPENAYQCANYYFDKSDTELYDIMPFLEHLSKLNDVRAVPNKRMEYELSHGIHKVKEVPKPVNIPNFEEIDIGEYAAIAPPKKLDVRNTLKSKKTNSSVSSCSSNLTTHHAISLKASFPSTFGKDSRTSSEQSIVMEKSMQLKNCPKTSGFQDVNTSTDDRDETGDTNESSGKQMHRSIVINHKEKGRSKLSVV